MSQIWKRRAQRGLVATKNQTIKVSHRATGTGWITLFCWIVVAVSPLHAELTFEASWQLPSYELVRGEVLAWLDEIDLAEDVAFEARSLWPVGNLRGAGGTALLDRVADTLALANPRAQALIEACNSPYAGPVPPAADWLEETSLPALLRNNLRLYYARWLAQYTLYDEVVSTLANLKTTDVVDPAGLLFYQMIAYHQLVEPDKSQLLLIQLLEQEEQLPRRYLQVAQLLRHDLASLKDESLDHVARRMNDVRRRLDIGRAGKQVQVVEKGVVDSLDRIIDKLEQQQQSQQSSKPGGGKQSAKPMQDSQLPAMRSPLQVEQRNIGNQSGWGDLPAKERKQALQQIGREFPAHYRELIQQYFRELADESKTTSQK